jgi:hypothetical protein
MSKKIFLHIGTHKTGTSAIQDFLVLNRKALSRQGILYPQKTRRDYFENKDGTVIVPARQFKNYQKLVCLGRAKKKHVILSNEAFSLMDDVSPIRAALGDVETIIICYLRRQDDFIQSYYNQEVKHAGNYNEIMAYQPPTNLHYDKLLARWVKVFGKENVVVRPYEKQQFKNQDLIADFLEIVGLELSADFKKLKKNANPRLPTETIEYMRLLNCLIKDKKQRKKVKIRLMDYSAARFKDGTESVFYNHALFSPDQKREIIARYDVSNQGVARDHLGWENGCLFQKPLPHDGVSESPEIRLTDEMIVEMTRSLCGSRKIRKILIRALEEPPPSESDSFVLMAREKISRAVNSAGNRR